MNWAKTKSRAFLIDITYCIYIIFLCGAFGRVRQGPQLKKDKKSRFRANVSISVKPRFTFSSFSSNSPQFLSLFRELSPRHTTYGIRHTLFQLPPILHANHPILHGNHPILHSNHPIQRGNYPRFPAWGPLLQALCTARLPSTGSGPELAEGSSPKSVHCSLSTASEVSGLRF